MIPSLLFATLLLSTPNPGTPTAAWQWLLERQEVPFSALPASDTAALHSVIASVLADHRAPSGYTPVLFANVSPAGTPSIFILVHQRQPSIIPGDARLHIALLNATGHWLSESEFSTGWRMQQGQIRLVRSTSIGRPLLAVSTSMCHLGTEFYGVVASRLVLVRIESPEGAVHRNTYVAPNWVIGPPLAPSLESVRGALVSSDAIATLSTLSWLAAKHWDLSRPQFFHLTTAEVLRQSRAATAARSDASVRASLSRLSRSSVTWIRDAAQQALHPRDGDTSFSVAEQPCQFH